MKRKIGLPVCDWSIFCGRDRGAGRRVGGSAGRGRFRIQLSFQGKAKSARSNIDLKC